MVAIPLDGPVLIGEVSIDRDARGIAVFADGSGIARANSTYQTIARHLQDRGLGTVIVDLLTEREGRDSKNRFDVDRLTDRLVSVLEWLSNRETGGDLPVCLVGANTGAAAAARMATEPDGSIRSLALLAGRIDLCPDAVPDVSVPTLLLLGSEDVATAELVLDQFDRLPCEKSFESIPGAGHALKHPEQIGYAADLIGDWFVEWVRSPEVA